MTAPAVGRAQVIGTGLIGGSIGLALRARHWHVSGVDRDPDRARRALEVGAVDRVGDVGEADITFVATPARSVGEAARRALDAGGVVTDVAGVKAAVVDALPHPRFVGGHPMAGSEQAGLDGADADLFIGATWVLTPTESTDAASYATVQSVAAGLGALVVAVPPRRHDDLVALVSHVPHLAAATLMNLASESALEHGTLLRLAAGGFRDMTRVAAGHPAIWPDLCADNRVAILAALDRLISELATVREVVEGGDRDDLLKLLSRASEARRNLPAGAPPPGQSVEVRVPVPDRPGVLAEVTTLLAEVGVNVYDIELAHSAEGERGVLVMVVSASAVPLVREILAGRGYRLSASRPGS
ncbi:MAG TPA: prephenate dehydrogenase/arogenate dehydrogenase family protein [Acidimicrobiales bacterium]|nr:prephenate dehydrogenase/arogenate dehydrogenase family protein [Acidimicrobiales bacterium]